MIAYTHTMCNCLHSKITLNFSIDDGLVKNVCVVITGIGNHLILMYILMDIIRIDLSKPIFTYRQIPNITCKEMLI
jgi:hypothetical protein